MSLDLGALVGRVILEDVQFQRTYARVYGQMGALGGQAEKASAGTATLDRGLNEVGASATKAGAGLDRATRATSATASAEQRAAAAAAQHARAVTEVTAAMSRLEGTSTAEQTATLRQVAAQDRLTAVQEGGAASTRQLAAAQASLIGATDRVAVAQAAAAESSSRWRTAMAGGLKTAAGLGLVVGGFELVKKAIDITKEANNFQRDMLLVQTQAGASAAQVKQFSSEVLALAGPTATAPEELALSLYHVVSAGHGLLTTAQELQVVKIAAEGAQVGNANLEQTTNALTATIASGIGGVKNYSQAMGELNAIVGSGDMKLSDLNDALSSGLLVTARTFNVTLPQVGAALAVFGDNNIRGADAATKLMMAIRDLAKPAAGADKVLSQVGLSAKDLQKDLARGGLTAALDDLSSHMKAAGVTGGQVGTFLVNAFTKKAGAGLATLIEEMDRYHVKLSQIQTGGQKFASAWTATTKTASFALASLEHGAEATGIALTEKLGPDIAAAARLLAVLLPAAIHAGEAALTPFVAAWHLGATVLGPVVGLLGDVVSHLGPLVPILTMAGGAALAMFAAFKGYQLARAAVFAIADGASVMSARVRNAAGDAAVSMGLMQQDMGAASVAFQADWMAIGAAATAGAAQIDRAAADAAAAQVVLARSIGTASEQEIAAYEAVAVAAEEQAAASATAAAGTAAAAAAAADAVVVSGEEASVGWASVAGPIGLAAVGVLAVVSMFHKSSTASKEATDAAKAYTDVLSGPNTKADFLDAITKQLSNNKVPETLAKLNSELGAVRFTGMQFVNAIQQGNPALATLRDRLEAVVKAGSTVVEGTGRMSGAVVHLTPAAQNATKALKDLNAQVDGLSKATKKDLLDTKAFAGVSSSIDKVSQATLVGSDTAKQYAAMLGIVVDKNGVAAVSAKTLQGAVGAVSNAYSTATQTGNDYLTALDAFSKSAGTAADRATLIGATLKANAGDALNFAAQMNAAATSVAQLGTDVSSAAKGIGKGGESTRSFLDSIISLKSGTIDYSDTAATPLISNLQSIQTAAINAATATFQHNRAFESGKKAADDAVAGYQGVESSLEGQLEKLGLTSGAAQRLTQKYLGVPSKVRTLIEQEGANPIVSVLNKIGTQLAYLTGHPWVAAVGVHDAASQRLENIKYLEDELHDKTITITTYNQLITAGTGSSTAGHHASGGTITGPGTGTSDSVPIMASTGEEVINARQAAKHRALLKAINAGRDGFATGGTVGSAIVAAGLAAAIRPPSSTTPQTFQRALAYDVPVANTAETRALAALAAYTKLEAELKRVEAEDRQASAAARGHTGALQDQAHSLADLASKLRAEASTAKSAYSTIGAAAKSAASKAADAAKSMIASLQSEVDAEKSAVSDFTSAVAQGIAGDFSVATLWGNVTTAAQTAADNLKAAQDAVNQATPDTAALAAAQTAQATATSKLAAAHKALADAQAAVAAGHGSPAQYAQLTTAEQGQSDAVSGLAAANQSLQAAQQAVANTAGPTADQLQALTDAQNAYNAAVANNSVAGLQNNLNQILASTKSFSTDLTALAKSGADQDFVAQIAAMGTTAGDALAKQLLAAGPSAIKSLQTTMLAISNVAGQEGDDLGKAFFGKGENALSQLAAGMKKQFPSLKTALAPIIAQLNAMFTFTPTVATLATTTHALEQAHTVGWLATNYHESVAQLLGANPSLKGASTGTVVGKGTKLTVPSFANGVKNFTGTAWVGEQGPELVNFARPVDVHRSGTPIIDITPLVNRLDAIERRLAAAPALIGAEVSTSGAGLYATAGKTHAHEVRRAFRKGAV